MFANTRVQRVGIAPGMTLHALSVLQAGTAPPPASPPALAAASLMNRTVLADSKALDQKERSVRQFGRIASYAGALAGTAGSVAAVSGMGTVAGLSGSGITTGLAAIGGLIGMGMGAGVAIATTAPVIAAAVVGYTTYKAAKTVAKAAKPKSVGTRPRCHLPS